MDEFLSYAELDGNGQQMSKRIEVVEELPVDKRACSSSDFRMSASTSSWTPEIDMEMDTLSWTSRSTQSKENGENGSVYEHFDSNHSIRNSYRRHLQDDQS
ncbi:E3 ubiquitin-protein ligase UPL4 [Olea europaea subsp. europaea]|uniref:E3 ubiquitin-protein ligase UPL4 n=1 Tax=Olea europaea subsp. europaea TaxID=158383 RepID=A0A8S0TYM2_OLEEU|nr:E3 ubiquitin-protein ligase UPL4 [Olea europaea subsp. europaea]